LGTPPDPTATTYRGRCHAFGGHRVDCKSRTGLDTGTCSSIESRPVCSNGVRTSAAYQR
jgi:hypothetical protein